MGTCTRSVATRSFSFAISHCRLSMRPTLRIDVCHDERASELSSCMHERGVRACVRTTLRNATKMGMARTPLPLKGLRLPLRFAFFVSLPLQLTFPLPLLITLLFPIRFAPAPGVR